MWFIAITAYALQIIILNMTFAKLDPDEKISLIESLIQIIAASKVQWYGKKVCMGGGDLKNV